MRTIKFRAWERSAKRMRYFGTPNYCSEYNLLAWELDRDSENTEGGVYCNLETSNIEGFDVMQFTGLLAKGGKEIYEGDILGHRDLKLTVVWHFNRWVLKTGTCIIEFKRTDSEFFEVIANVHENPELLI